VTSARNGAGSAADFRGSINPGGRRDAIAGSLSLMEHWDLKTVDASGHMPRILSSSAEARLVVLAVPAGERLQDHEVHERAWVVVVEGQVMVSAGAAEPVQGNPGTLFEFAPHERREVLGVSDARILLILAPWPGDGHPGAMSLGQKGHARADAAEHLARAGRPTAG
jgi:redox-sensitive bicupin YhaK (pirin superfamily)